MRQITHQINKNQYLFLVFMLVIAGQSAIDIYLPAFPRMVDYFQTTKELVQLTLSFYVFSYAGSQLIYGPLSDHFGRRPVLIFSLSLFAVSSFGCYFAPTIETFLLFRFLQGLGAGAANVHQRVLIRDMFDGKELHKYGSFVAAVWALVPILAPILGGYLQYYFNWRICFLFLGCMETLLLFAIIYALPETLPKKPSHPFTLGKIMYDYKNLLAQKIFITNALCCSLLNGIFLSFNVAGPFLLQTQLNLTPVQYGWTMLISAGSFLTSSYMNSFLTQRYPIYKVISLGFIIMLVSLFFLLAFNLINTMTVITFMVPIGGLFLGIGFIYANCVANSIKSFPNNAGSAGALFGCSVSLMGALISMFIAEFSAISFSHFITILLTLYLLSMLSWLSDKKMSFS